jgi:hypothetical protein
MAPRAMPDPNAVNTSAEKTMGDDTSFETQLIHAGPAPDPAYGAVVPPIYLSSTYQQRAVGVHQGYDYSRTANPTPPPWRPPWPPWKAGSEVWPMPQGWRPSARSCAC